MYIPGGVFGLDLFCGQENLPSEQVVACHEVDVVCAGSVGGDGDEVRRSRRRLENDVPAVSLKH